MADSANVTKSWVDIREEGAPKPDAVHPVGENLEAKQHPSSGETLSPLLVERHKDEELSSVLSSPFNAHSDSSGESFEISDAFDTLSTNDAGQTQKEASKSGSLASSGGSEDSVEPLRRKRSSSMSSRKKRGIGSSSRSFSADNVTLSSFSSRPVVPVDHSLSSPHSASSPSLIPPQLAPLVQNSRALSLSVVSFLVGMLVAYFLLKRQASLKKSDRLHTEASLRQMLMIKEAEVNRLNNLFEKYLSRPLMLRYLPNRF